MESTEIGPGITFDVDDVVPATEPLRESAWYANLKRSAGGRLESCSDYHASVVQGIDYHPLLAAVYTAFCQHRPLILAPDAVWITIAQGVAHHMVVHGERLRPRFVEHAGKLELAFECRGWVPGSPENPWPGAFQAWTDRIREHVGGSVYDTLVCDFSTTGPVERAASQVVMMDVFERYFHYVLYGVCGIPAVTLEGTADDWARLRDKAATLDAFDLGWWLDHLLPMCDQFVRASRGDVDLDHWRSICKLRSEYGGDIINGWVARLFPYLRAYTNGPCTRRNPIFETDEGFTTWVAPPGLSRVPFTWRDLMTGQTRPMEALGGLVGVSQVNLALRPKVGWVIREADRLDALLRRVEREHATFPGAKIDDRTYFPPDLARFYHGTDGAALFGQGESAACRFLPASEVEPLDWGETESDERIRFSRGPGDRSWQRLAVLPNGQWLAINLDPNRRDPRPDDPRRRLYDPEFSPICLGSDEMRGQPGRHPVIALSFTELLDRLLNQGPTPYWLESRFIDHGDAEVYTRR